MSLDICFYNDEEAAGVCINPIGFPVSMVQINSK